MSRWLYNAEAVQTWAESKPQVPPLDIAWWPPLPPRLPWFQVGGFIGHGRRMHYYGLVTAFVDFIEMAKKNGEISPECVHKVKEFASLEGKSPGPGTSRLLHPCC
jgi:hypothetical protein